MKGICGETREEREGREIEKKSKRGTRYIVKEKQDHEGEKGKEGE